VEENFDVNVRNESKEFKELDFVENGE